MADEKKLPKLSFSGMTIPECTIRQYQRHASSVKLFNEWMIKDLRVQLADCQQTLQEKEKFLSVCTQKLSDMDTQLQLTKQELSQFKSNSMLQFTLGVISTLSLVLG